MVLSGQAELAWIESLPERAASLENFSPLDVTALRPEPEDAAKLWRERLGIRPQVSVVVEGSELVISGSAPQAWIRQVSASLPAVDAVIRRFQTGRLVAQELNELDSLTQQIQRRQFSYAEGTTLDAPDHQALPDTINDVSRAVRLNETLGRPPLGLHITGYSDKLGRPRYNEQLRLRRAETFKTLIAAALPAGVALDARAASAAENNAMRPARRMGEVEIVARAETAPPVSP